MTGARTTRVLLAMGAIAVVLAAAPYKAFDLDRFFVPKELVLHLTALAVAIVGLRRARSLELTRVDFLLAAYITLSAVSALFATNHWLAARALAITLSCAAVYWASRVAADGGRGGTIVAACAAAAVLGAAISLAQAYGVTSEYFSLNRAPGGTFGNRNFMAHLAAIGTPAVVLCAIASRRTWVAVLGAFGISIIFAALVLSRTRAAWLGLGAGAALLVLGLWRAHRRWSDPGAARRMQSLALAAGLGVLAALLIPNTLEWKSDSPYLDTVTGVVNYREGSGRGRVVQYTNTSRIAVSHPLLGVGPGNWAVIYPRVATPNDPSLDLDDGMTSNPWPSSDWAAIAAERGFPALIALSLGLFGLAMGAWRRADRAAAADQYLEGLALATTLVVTVIVGAFDAVLLLPAPALIAWALFGALAAPSPVRKSVPLGIPGRRRLLIAAIALGAAGIIRSSAQLAAMAVYSDARTASQYETAALLDPGSYRIKMKLAQIYQDRGSCERVRDAAGAALKLFPSAPDPARMLRACGVRVRAPR
jgi:O-antigen ligase